MANPSAFEVEEITGSRRVVRLRGRALPYRGIGWGSRMRQRTTWYPGNPVGTMQVLGPEQMNLEIEGRWSDRFLAPFVEVEGFEAVELAEDLVEVFEEILRSGNALRVRWAGYVREGILEQFEPKPDRAEDVRWSMSFAWYGRGERVPRAIIDEEPPQAELRARMNAVDDQLAFEPEFTIPDYGARVVSGIASIRDRASKLLDNVRTVERLGSVPVQAARAAASLSESIRSETEEELQRLLDLPIEYAQTAERVHQTLTMEGWRRTLARRMHRFRSEALRQSRRLERRAKPSPFREVVIGEGQTLRDLAMAFYGDADSWLLIARANGFSSSQVPAGTVILIPPQSASQEREG